MSQPLRRRPVIKKRAKPLAEVHKGLMHQSTKLVSKTVKLVKAFLVQKCTRKIAELKESNGDITEEVNRLSDLKALDHSQYAVVTANKMLSIGNKDIETEDIDENLLETIMKQKKIIDVIQDINKHIAEAVDKNNTRRALEQRNEARQAKKAKNLLQKRSLSLKDRTEAVFLDTLEAPESKPADAISKKKQKELDRVKIEKSRRNAQNRLKNKAGKGGDATVDGIKSFKKRKFSSRSAGDEPSDTSPSIYGPGNSRSNNSADASSSGKRKSSRDDVYQPPAKHSKHDNAAAIPNIPTEKLEKFVASGKDWKEAGLHPSWAAKQLSKKASPLVIAAGAPAGQGKKITFD